ncbi:hypothetical protein [Sporosarcina luteola]|uniref:hypothetical protein n=1 Tax=Sporosarcina luteola TaxID=582850 RepID=UPI0020416219|nr:hypothetical protein [Sporosarcina luteola]MCM3711112.1 hypothetical protein [Sporosarcina luteola]
MNRLLLFLLGFTLVVTGCTPAQSALEKAVENNRVNPMVDGHYDFTYLEELPNDKLVSYDDFPLNENINSLSNFTPEEMLLIYMNLVY